MNRRNFLKLSGLALGSTLAKPPADIDWPEGVVTKFDLEADYFAFTVDDGFYAEDILPFVRYCHDFHFRGTWFANGRGIVDIRNIPEIIDIMVLDGWTVGYHTMHHPAIEDQLQNYNRQRWLDDYDEWLDLAMTTFPDGLHDRRSIVRPHARAAGGLFARPFMEMCEDRALTPYGWSKDPSWINHHPDQPRFEPGDIFLTHFRSSEWVWFQRVSWVLNELDVDTIDAIARMSRLESMEIERLARYILEEWDRLLIYGDN